MIMYLSGNALGSISSSVPERKKSKQRFRSVTSNIFQRLLFCHLKEYPMIFLTLFIYQLWGYHLWVHEVNLS